MNTTKPEQHPVVLTCPSCNQSVVLHIPAVASCVRCARRMVPRMAATTRKAAQA